VPPHPANVIAATAAIVSNERPWCLRAIRFDAIVATSRPVVSRARRPATRHPDHRQENIRKSDPTLTRLRPVLDGHRHTHEFPSGE
jgi:hypothetical protein